MALGYMATGADQLITVATGSFPRRSTVEEPGRAVLSGTWDVDLSEPCTRRYRARFCICLALIPRA